MRSFDLFGGTRIAWNPGTDQVELLFFPMNSEIDSEKYPQLAKEFAEDDEECARNLEKYRYFWGISASNLEKLTPAEVKQMVMTQALHLIITYRVDPDAVHQALLELVEYADGWADLFTQHLE